MDEVNELTKKDTEESKKGGGSGSDNEKPSPPPPTAAAAADPEPMEDVEATTKPKEPKSEAPPDAEEMDIESEPPAAESDSKVEPSATVETEAKHAAENDAEPKTATSVAATDAIDVDPAEDFVVIESGGERDQLAQEKAVEKEKEKGEDSMVTEKSEDIAAAKEGKEDVSAGAQPPNNVDSAIASEPNTEMKGNFTPHSPLSAVFRTF
jgi:hypothetical protein